MVAQERVHAAAGLAGLGLQAHEQLERVAGAVAPVGQVPRLHEVRLAAHPVVLRVDEAREPEHLLERVHVPVHVRDGDDALHSLEDEGVLRLRGGGAGEHGQQQAEEDGTHGLPSIKGEEA